MTTQKTRGVPMPVLRKNAIQHQLTWYIGERAVTENQAKAVYAACLRRARATPA